MKFDKLFFRHDEAVALGSSDKAIILEFIRWSCHFKESEAENEYTARKYLMDGHWWMQDSFEAWQNRMPWLSIVTLKRYFEDLYERGFIDKKIINYGHGRIPNFYRPLPKYQNDTKTPSINLINPKYQNDTRPSIKLSSTSLSKNHTHKSAKNPDTPPGVDTSLVLAIEKKSKSPKYDPKDLELGHKWLEFALSEMKWKKPSPSWTPERFADALFKVRDTSGITHDGLIALLEFIRKDNFWRDKALSPSSLLKKNSDDVRKIDNILLQATKNERKSDRIIAMINSNDDPF